MIRRTWKTLASPYNTPQWQQPNFWPNTTSAWFFILETHSGLHRTTTHDLRFPVLVQWLTEKIANHVSGVHLGPTSDTPYKHSKVAICRPTSCVRQPTLMNLTDMKLINEAPSSLSNAAIIRTENMRAEKRESFSERSMTFICPGRSQQPTFAFSNSLCRPYTY